MSRELSNDVKKILVEIPVELLPRLNLCCEVFDCSLHDFLNEAVSASIELAYSYATRED